MPSLSTHVLDASRGGPRPDVRVEVRDHADACVGRGVTDGRGRVEDLAAALAPGRYRIVWRLGGSFVDEVSATVDLLEERHYHVPALATDGSVVVYLGA
ncbi:MAG TPA: hydroxyisourate hydrolase [Acidimicrobiales bacterium]|jgi:5-hydroxyisourate hydrolase